MLCNRPVEASDELLQDAWQRGWLEEQDVLQGDSPVERRTVARIIHRYLQVVCKEADEQEWGEAKKLLDLYDCHICVNHVAQVYAKGIMRGVKENVFGMRRMIAREEAAEIVTRVLTPEKRFGRALCEKKTIAQRIDIAQAQALPAVWIDVRTETEYEQGHMPGAIHLPLLKILEQPELLLPKLKETLIFYCEGGYQSELAAEQAVEAGGRSVYYAAISNEQITRFV